MLKGAAVSDVRLVKLHAVLQCCNSAQSSTFWGQRPLTDIRRMQAFPAENFRARCCDYGKNCVFVCLCVLACAWMHENSLHRISRASHFVFQILIYIQWHLLFVVIFISLRFTLWNQMLYLRVYLTKKIRSAVMI